ncbi:META domain-containing protein [Falsiroseomonas sp. HW251]|uniref:META domain-containing protein n=1 Tax=Falsiroseomonas sp. HW251 TaxID=3390998 RepID=UPI003D3230AB
MTTRRTLLAASLLATPAAAQPPDPIGPEWVVEDIGGRGIVDRSRVTIAFAGDGRAAGSDGCNRFAGGYTLAGAALSFSALAGTRMACAPALMEQEQRFHAALAAVRGWRIERGFLHLTDGAGATVLRASRGG